MSKVAISIEGNLLKKLDSFVKKKIFKNRSQAIQIAVNEVIERIEHKRLAKECEKLDIHFEQKMADMGLTKDSEEWPPY